MNFSKTTIRIVSKSLLILATTVSLVSVAAPKKSPKKADIEKPSSAMVYFEEPQDGATVEKKFKVVMGVMGYTVKPAGDKTPNSGHHHIVVDADLIPEKSAIPMDAKHLHFGKGQTETELELPSGKHILHLQFADMNHIAIGLNKTITVNVK